MNSAVKARSKQFNALQIRERALIAIALFTVLSLGWWKLYGEQAIKINELQVIENNRLSAEIETTLAAVNQVNAQLSAGVNQQKQQKLAQLNQQLDDLENRLQLKTVELIDPEDMLQLMRQLIYKESKLKLMSLNRREVKPAIVTEDDQAQDSGIYRHVLEVKFAGKFVDILGYMQSLEKLDWKLIWDEIEILGDDYPVINVKLVLSTLSTKKEWLGV